MREVNERERARSLKVESDNRKRGRKRKILYNKKCGSNKNKDSMFNFE